MEELNPPIIVPLGNHAKSLLLPEYNQGIVSMTGQTVTKDGIIYVPIVHPRYPLMSYNNPDVWPRGWWALKKVIEDAQS